MRRPLLATALMQALFSSLVRAQGLTGNEVKGSARCSRDARHPRDAFRAGVAVAVDMPIFY